MIIKKDSLYDVYEHLIDHLYQLGSTVCFKRGQQLTKQYQRGANIYFLLKGQLDINARNSPEDAPVSLGKTQTHFAPVGWSSLISPHRYAVDISVSSEVAEVLQISIHTIETFIKENQELSIQFFQFLLARAEVLIHEALEDLSTIAPEWEQSEAKEHFEESDPSTINLKDFIRQSPFFETFDDTWIQSFANCLTRRDYRSGDVVASQGTEKEGLYLLQSGWIDFHYENEEGKNIRFRSISTPGFNVGWTELTHAKYYATAIARRTSSLLYIDSQQLKNIFETDPTLSHHFYRRLLWMVSHQLQMIRTRLLTYRLEAEWIAVKTVIEANATKLSLHSDLHDIPHLLQHKHSQRRAFQILHRLHDEGTVYEKHLASVCLDNLEELKKEYHFYYQLMETYQKVVSMPSAASSEEIRSVCSESIINAFEKVNVSMQGWENLPEKGGHIFIYNHLKNHPYNTLPNHFQVTLDSHFVSAMVSYKKYGDPGLRIVRVGRDIEYGHQEYYQRLGHIDVYTQESEAQYQTKAEKEAARKQLNNRAGSYLATGRNIIISPEGTSYETMASPGPFKSGAFKMALHQESEPMIVPIVLANFDHRARYNQYKCAIYPAFKMSDHLSDPNDKDAMMLFLNDFQNWYRNKVQELSGL